MESYVGEIRLFPYTFAPVGWADCNGQLLSISENETLFVLLGTTYGGDGVNTFALPDLRGRIPLHNGRASSGNVYTPGQIAGSEAVTLLPGQIPAHTHPTYATTALADTNTPSTAVELGSLSGDTMYTSTPTQVLPVNGQMVSATGGTQPHENRMPTLTLRFCISLYGIYPSQG
ncbi:phage tail protein [Luteibacter yeojuensis]|uniref:Phage tail protein n=1 Tax=Luteibacter yeojuensis TaxID=345309 RepID=A0A7X5QW16_9GAMM|nr:tail fiber protein [Luteibacter yeojuensis]NID16465.1 phage tail protein [Luteibacter yeojuensis]